MPPHEERDFVSGTIFSGCGGAGDGLKQAGGKILFALDNNQKARYAYDLNAPDVHIFQDSIKAITGIQMMDRLGIGPGYIEIMELSPPCQGSSLSNTKSRTMDNENNLLAYDGIRLVNDFQPLIAILENVSGMILGAFGEHHANLKFKFEQSGYDVYTWHLDSSEYGCIQARKRSWMIGIRKNLGFKGPLNQPERFPYFVSVHHLLPHLLGIVNGQSVKYCFPTNGQCPTITFTPGMEVIDYKYNQRPPTARELLVLSSFPPNYKFGNLSRNDVHHLVGNAVLPQMMKVIAEHLYDTVLVPYRASLTNTLKSA